MIKCYLCPLNDVCLVIKLGDLGHGIPIKLEWLPDGNELKCPLYKAANEHSSTNREEVEVIE